MADLYPHGEPNLMKDAPTGKKSKAKIGTDWDRLHHMSDAELRAAVESDPDARHTYEEFWKDAEEKPHGSKNAVPYQEIR